MIRGVVDVKRGILIPLILRGSNGVEMDVNAVVDTGFSADLTVASALAESLGFVATSVGKSRLADGSIVESALYAAEVFWDGTWRPVLASAIGDEVLVGMRLLNGSRLRIDAIPGGNVEISQLNVP